MSSGESLSVRYSTVLNLSSKMMWNCREVLPVHVLRTNEGLKLVFACDSFRSSSRDLGVIEELSTCMINKKSTTCICDCHYHGSLVSNHDQWRYSGQQKYNPLVWCGQLLEFFSWQPSNHLTNLSQTFCDGGWRSPERIPGLQMVALAAMQDAHFKQDMLHTGLHGSLQGMNGPAWSDWHELWALSHLQLHMSSWTHGMDAWERHWCHRRVSF